MLARKIPILDNTKRMPRLDPKNPERFTLLKYPTSGRVQYIDKIFDDPDFIRLYLGARKTFDISWATNANPAQSVDLVSDLAEQYGFETGTIALSHTFRRPDTVIGGTNLFEGSAEDIMNEVQDAGDRATGYSLRSRSIELFFQPSWPRTYHDIATHEFALRLNRKDRMARYTVGKAISLTAMDSLKQSADTTLDELAEYLPALRG